MRVLPTVSLTANQKRVLAKIVASPTPKVAGEEISGNQNLAGARDQLAKLGAIEFVAGEASLTTQGEQLAKDSNLMDDSGQLTPDGEQLAHTQPDGQQDKEAPQQPAQTPPPGVGGAPAPMGGAPGDMPGGNDLFMSHYPMTFKQFLNEGKEKHWSKWTEKDLQRHTAALVDTMKHIRDVGEKAGLGRKKRVTKKAK